MKNCGYCKLCRKYSQLQNSHAIGDTIFKKITRRNSGKAISVTAEMSVPVHYTSDSWAEYQLCAVCEGLLNKRYETYAVNLLRGKYSAKISKTGVTFNNVDQGLLKKYFLSIIWRSVLSTHPAYDNTSMLPQDLEYIRLVLLNDLDVPNSKYTIKVQRVQDMSIHPTFTPQTIKELIVSPFCRTYSNPTNVSVCLLFEGFFIEVLYKAVAPRERKCFGILNSNSSSLFVPFVNIFSIREVYDLMALGHDKNQNGITLVR
ncbi:hypothetical protein AB4138_07650 [Vibrio sp. 10N.286.52.C3]|uniref:hypothetical protein n=1 Tax=Vibrio TaxID=662 RepID=UPI0010554087|nr:hypothetical protein [Vibrio cyclitrophicus]